MQVPRRLRDEIRKYASRARCFQDLLILAKLFMDERAHLNVVRFLSLSLICNLNVWFSLPFCRPCVLRIGSPTSFLNIQFLPFHQHPALGQLHALRSGSLHLRLLPLRLPGLRLHSPTLSVAAFHCFGCVLTYLYILAVTIFPLSVSSRQWLVNVSASV